MSDSDFKTVIVLGMHRSGTSMTSAILNELGVNMGEKLLGKQRCNPIGHFEDLEFLNLNINILKESGGNWEYPPEKKAILQQKNKFHGKIKKLTDKPSQEIWGWKDPRNSLTIDLYLPYLINPYFIVCYRNTEEICKSLYTKVRLSTERGIKLTKIYEERIDNFFRKNKNLNRLNLHYSNALNNPKEYVESIIKFLRIEVSEDQRKSAISLILSKKELNKLADNLDPI